MLIASLLCFTFLFLLFTVLTRTISDNIVRPCPIVLRIYIFKFYKVNTNTFG